MPPESDRWQEGRCRPWRDRLGGCTGDAKGELGIRHEDTVAVTDSGCENVAPKWSGTLEEPAVV